MAGQENNDPNVAPDYAKFFEPMPLDVLCFWLQAVFNDRETQRNVYTIMADWWNAQTDEARSRAAEECARKFYSEEAYAKWAEGAGRRIVTQGGRPADHNAGGGRRILRPGEDF